MVREVTFKVYQFDELSEEVKEKVLDDNRYVAVDYFDWYCDVYSDAEEIGFKIEEFDLYRKYIKVRLNTSVLSSVEWAMNYFGKDTKGYKIAKSYYDEIMKLADSDEVKEYLEENPDDDAYDAIYNLSLDDLFYDDYVYDMRKVFLKMLEDEFNYLTSDEFIIDMFEANDYEFFETGKVFNAMEFVLNS